MNDERLKTIAVGYLRANGRLQEVQGRAYSHLPETTLPLALKEEAWAALFEALSWLDVLLLQREVEQIMIDDRRRKLLSALRFVRGRVHHHLVDAIEFRADVPLELGPNIAGPLLGTEPLVLADWAWVEASRLARSGTRVYEDLLAGRQVRESLIDMSDVAARVYNQLSTRPSS